MRLFAVIGLVALAGCAQGEPNYSAIICLEDHSQRHIVEADFVRFFEQRGYEVEKYKYGVGYIAKKFWDGRVLINFDTFEWEPEHPMMVTTHSYLGIDDPNTAEYKVFVEAKWDGFERLGRTYADNECKSIEGSLL